jgi:Ca2+-binding EF-hand superfamily protein
MFTIYKIEIKQFRKYKFNKNKKKREQFLNIFDKNIMASFLEKKIRTLFVRFDMDGNGAIEGLFILFLIYYIYIK